MGAHGSKHNLELRNDWHALLVQEGSSEVVAELITLVPELVTEAVILLLTHAEAATQAQYSAAVGLLNDSAQAAKLDWNAISGVLRSNEVWEQLLTLPNAAEFCGRLVNQEELGLDPTEALCFVLTGDLQGESSKARKKWWWGAAGTSSPADTVLALLKSGRDFDHSRVSIHLVKGNMLVSLLEPRWYDAISRMLECMPQLASHVLIAVCTKLAVQEGKPPELVAFGNRIAERPDLMSAFEADQQRIQDAIHRTPPRLTDTVWRTLSLMVSRGDHPALEQFANKLVMIVPKVALDMLVSLLSKDKPDSLKQAARMLTSKPPVPFDLEDLRSRLLADWQAPMGLLIVIVVAGQNLKAMDRSAFGRGSSDPYTVVSLQGNGFGGRPGKSYPLGKTDVEKANLNPKFNTRLEHTVTSKQLVAGFDLKFDMFDYDRVGADDPMGSVSIPFSAVLQGGLEDKWHKLQPCPDCPVTEGSMHLQLEWVPVDAQEGGVAGSGAAYVRRARSPLSVS